MLSQANATATIGVKDIHRANDFYKNKLGLTPAGGDEAMGVLFFKSGNTKIEVYKSDFAGSNKATNVTWTVGDNIEKEVQNLKQKGIEFEHYQMPEVKLQGDIHVMKDMKAAWFKDPDGNILCMHDH